MKHAIKFVFFLGFVALIISSCDPGFSYSKRINNNSKYDILIINVDTVNKGYNNNQFDTIQINSFSEKEIAHDGGLGSITDFENCDVFNDSLLVKIIGYDSLQLIRDINNNGNWRFNQLSDKSGGTGECIFLIDNRMIK